jgi:hypothetical protein
MFNPDACSLRAAAELFKARKTVLVFVAILPGHSSENISGGKVLAELQVRTHRNSTMFSGPADIA